MTRFSDLVGTPNFDYPFLPFFLLNSSPGHWVKQQSLAEDLATLEKPCCSPGTLVFAQGTGSQSGWHVAAEGCQSPGAMAIHASAWLQWFTSASALCAWWNGSWRRWVFNREGTVSGARLAYMVLLHHKSRISLILRESLQLMKHKNTPVCSD